MRKRIAVPCALLALAGGVVLFPPPASSQQEELDPVKIAADTHKLVFENQFLRVIQAKVPAGGIEPKHKHPKGVTVYMTDYTIEQRSLPGGNWTRGDRRFGAVTWSDAVVHEVRNIGKTPSHALRIELKY